MTVGAGRQALRGEGAFSRNQDAGPGDLENAAFVEERAPKDRMVPILDCIVENGCDASETLTPPEMGGDARPVVIKERIGPKVCLIGGLNQFQVLDRGSRGEIRDEVFRLFEQLGEGGGYIMSPSDHFFDARPQNLQWYAEAARECRYS